MFTTALIASLLKWGGILIGGLTLFFGIRKGGVDAQIATDEKAKDELQKKINNVPTGTPDSTIDSLRDDKF